MTRSIDTDAAVVLHERLFDAVDPAAWDRFVVASGASFLGSWKVIAAEGLTRSVRVFEILSPAASGLTKVGQCALATNHGHARFLDRLQLLPVHAHLWPHALRQVIDRCGASRYTYGSLWNHEARCPVEALASLPSHRLDYAPFGIDHVAFAAWPGFAAYRRAISENIRRDFKKAAASSPVVVTRRGLAAVRDVPVLVALRREVMRRNSEAFSSVADAPRHVLKLFAMRDDAFISTVEAEGVVQAAFFGVSFGDAVYYLSGGTRGGSQGYGSYLFLTLIERWFAEQPRGTLYLGENLPNVDPRTYTRGNLLYRRKLRADVSSGTAFTIAVG